MRPLDEKQHQQSNLSKDTRLTWSYRQSKKIVVFVTKCGKKTEREREECLFRLGQSWYIGWGLTTTKYNLEQ